MTATMEQRVSLITLAVDDLDRAASFYEALGWRRVEGEEGVVAFDLIGQTLGLYPRTALAEELGMDPSEIGGFSGLTLAYNVREPAEVTRILEAVAAHGGCVLKPAQEVSWGGFHGYFADPDGHVWEVAHNPFSPLGPMGEFRWGGAER